MSQPIAGPEPGKEDGVQATGIVTATKNARWFRVVPTDPTSEFSNAMIAAGEFNAGDRVNITIVHAHGEDVTTAQEA